MDKYCSKCRFFDICSCHEVCSHYSPQGRKSEDDIVNEIIEIGRDEYRQAWFEYISEYDSDYDDYKDFFRNL